MNSAYDASALPIIRKLDWPTINELIESETLKMVYKSVNDQAPTYLAEMFVRVSDSSKRVLRNRPFSDSEKESQSNDTLLHFVEVSNVHNSDRSSNAIRSNLVYKNV